eukprot:scaffold5545_cov68-Phaeocystis_antarctica.AAC.2
MAEAEGAKGSTVALTTSKPAPPKVAYHPNACRRGDRCTCGVGPVIVGPMYRVGEVCLCEGAASEEEKAEGPVEPSVNDRGRAVRGFDLRGWKAADIQGLRGADGKLDLEGAILCGVNLDGAKLQGAYLQSAQLQGADPSCAKLQGANLGGARLPGAYLGGALLQGASGLPRWGGAPRGCAPKYADARGHPRWGAAPRGQPLRGAAARGKPLQGAAPRSRVPGGGPVRPPKGLPSPQEGLGDQDGVSERVGGNQGGPARKPH